MRETYRQLPMMPVFRCEAGDFRTLQEAAKALGKVTANLDHEPVRRPGDAQKHAYHAKRAREICKGTFARSTLLKEVSVVVMEPDPTIHALYEETGGQEPWRYPDQLADQAIGQMSLHIDRHWDPDARHLVMFSSGYDSRLLGLLIKRLRDLPLGASLGDRITFACFQPEIEYAKPIFDHLGFPAHMWRPIRPDAPALDYYADCLDFETVGANLSDAERFWGGPLLVQLELEAEGFFDEAPWQWQGVSAIFSDETIKWNRVKWGDVAWLVACYLFDQGGLLPGRPEMRFLLPFASNGWLRALTRYRIPLALDEWKLHMIQRLDPELADLERFPNYRFQIGPTRKELGGHIHQQEISEETAERMHESYERSWYAANGGPKADWIDLDDKRVMQYFSPWGTTYIKAAIYEHLLQNGVEVTL